MDEYSQLNLGFNAMSTYVPKYLAEQNFKKKEK